MSSQSFSFHPALPADVKIPATLDFNLPFMPQVQKILEAAGPGLCGASEVAVSGQAVAAILMVAGLEMVSGLPVLTTYSFGKEVKPIGTLSLNDFRHQTVRARRNEIPKRYGDGWKAEEVDSRCPNARYIVLDGSGRGLTPVQLEELAKALGVEALAIEVINVCKFGPKADGQADFTNPTLGMVESILSVGLTVSDWALRRVLYMPAGSGLASVIQATVIHGLSESWPRTIRLVSGADKVFHVSEIVDPQDMRQWGVAMTAKWQADQTSTVLAELAKRLNEYGVGVVVEGTTLKVGFPDNKAFTLNVTSAS